MTDSDVQSTDRLIRHTRDSYGGAFHADLLEQYKLFVQSAENVSARRLASNRYLLTLSAALVASYGFGSVSFGDSWWMLGIPIAGLLVSLLWYQIIKSHAGLNRVKFKIIHELEERLPAAVYRHEWKLGNEGRGKVYRAVTQLERWIPAVFALLHLGLGTMLVLEKAGVVDWVGW